MFCPNCGKQIPDDARFCDACGSAVDGSVLVKDPELQLEVREEPELQEEVTESPEPQEKKTKRKRKTVTYEPFSENISRGTDGSYKWTCERSLFKDPTIFWLCFKVIIGTTAGVMLLISLISAIADGFTADSLRFMGTLTLGMSGLMAVLLCLGYLLYAAIMGGKYVVDFTMDDKVLVHAQGAKQAEKAKKIAILTILAGMFSRRVTTVGVGMNAGRTTSTTVFESVKKVTVNEKRSLIKLWGGGSNYIYTAPEDFTFVRDFVQSHVDPAVKWIEK